MAAIAKQSPRRAIQEIIHGQRRVLGTKEDRINNKTTANPSKIA